MNQEDKDAWLTALRSGKYKRGTARLKKKVDEVIKHCCLGVLCEIFKDRFHLVEIKLDARKDYTFNDSNLFLPNVVSDELGISPELQEILSQINDSGLHVDESFDRIADWIELNVETNSSEANQAH